MKSRCEIDPLLNPGQRHVTVSGKTYLNYACALCNQEDLTGSNVIYWPLEMVCSSFINKTADGEWSYEQVIDFVFNTAVKGMLKFVFFLRCKMCLRCSCALMGDNREVETRTVCQNGLL